MGLGQGAPDGVVRGAGPGPAVRRVVELVEVEVARARRELDLDLAVDQVLLPRQLTQQAAHHPLEVNAHVPVVRQPQDVHLRVDAAARDGARVFAVVAAAGVDGRLASDAAAEREDVGVVAVEHGRRARAEAGRRVP
eukprot:1481850-Pleurochrysis_carterae.AAC.3